MLKSAMDLNYVINSEKGIIELLKGLKNNNSSNEGYFNKSRSVQR